MIFTRIETNSGTALVFDLDINQDVYMLMRSTYPDVNKPGTEWGGMLSYQTYEDTLFFPKRTE